MLVRNIDQLSFIFAPTGTKPPTQLCALTWNRTWQPFVAQDDAQPTGHSGRPDVCLMNVYCQDKSRKRVLCNHVVAWFITFECLDSRCVVRICLLPEVLHVLGYKAEVINTSHPHRLTVESNYDNQITTCCLVLSD